MYRTLYLGIHAVQPPAFLARALELRGGRNEHGEPMFRLVRSEGRKRMSGGEWYEWDKSISIRHRNPGSARPLRVVVGYKPVPCYPGEHGWILEQWTSPDKYGSPVQWYSPASMGGTLKWMPKLNRYLLGIGHFPHRGDYEGTGYIFPNHALSEALILNAIGRIVHLQDGLPPDPHQRALQQSNYDTQAEREQERAFEKFSNDQLEDSLDELKVSTPGAKAEVCKFAESIGIREHPF